MNEIFKNNVVILNKIENNEESLADVEQIYIYLSRSRVSPYLYVMAVCYGRMQWPSNR